MFLPTFLILGTHTNGHTDIMMSVVCVSIYMSPPHNTTELN